MGENHSFRFSFISFVVKRNRLSGQPSVGLARRLTVLISFDIRYGGGSKVHEGSAMELIKTTFPQATQNQEDEDRSSCDWERSLDLGFEGYEKKVN